MRNNLKTETRNNLKTEMRNNLKLEDVIRLAVKRESKGIEIYGPESYKKNDIWQELIQELLDQINYSYLQILKIIEANLLLNKIEINDENIKNLLGKIIDLDEVNKRVSHAD